MENKNIIPTRFTLYASTVNIVWNDKLMDDMKAYGYWHPSDLTITLSKVDGQRTLSEDKMMDTFYHEKVHAILDTMQEYDLSKNEKFVDTFAKLLRQSDATSEFH